MEKLPNNIHLVTLGTFSPKRLEGDFSELVASLGMKKRIHFTPPVPYAELIDVASAADLGLILIDDSRPNVRVSLPNRVFDYLAAKLPILSVYIEDIDKIITESRCGISVTSMENDSWVRAVNFILDNQKKMSENAELYSKEKCWEMLEGNLESLFLGANSVTFVGMNDLVENNRTMRIANSLHDRAVKVKIACSLTSDKVRPDQFEWFHINSKELI